MSAIDWTQQKDDRTCIACGYDLESEDGALETLADLRYNSQGFIDYQCPKCGVLLSIQEEEITTYHVRKRLS